MPAMTVAAAWGRCNSVPLKSKCGGQLRHCQANLNCIEVWIMSWWENRLKDKHSPRGKHLTFHSTEKWPAMRTSVGCHVSFSKTSQRSLCSISTLQQPEAKGTIPQGPHLNKDVGSHSVTSSPAVWADAPSSAAQPPHLFTLEQIPDLLHPTLIHPTS